MYHLSGISSLARGRRRRSSSLSDALSTPLSPSVLDFSEYVSRQCEKKLQRRVRQLTAKSNRQLATITKLRRQLIAHTTPLHDVSNTLTSAASTDDRRSLSLNGAAASGETEAVCSEATSAQNQEGVEDERMDNVEAEQAQQSGSSPVEAQTAGREEQDHLDDSLLEGQEGQQCVISTKDADGQAAEGIDRVPCSPIPVGRHKRGRTDDSEQCSTSVSDAQWKRSRDEEEEVRHEQQTATAEQSDHQTSAELFVAAVAPSMAAGPALLAFKPALLRPFPMSHAQLQSNTPSGSLTPYRGLLRPFPLALNQSPSRIAQPAL